VEKESFEGMPRDGSIKKLEMEADWGMLKDESIKNWKGELVEECLRMKV